MQRDRRLEWVTTNRAPRRPLPRIGPMVADLVEGSLSRGTAERAQLATVLAGCVDEEFRRHCRMGEVREGMLVMEVDEPGLISIVRARWASKIESLLRKRGAKSGARGVLFQFGRSGDRLQ